MLILTRKSNESVVVGRAGSRDPMLTVKVLGIRGGKVRLGFAGDADIPIHRAEVWEQICNDDRPVNPTETPEVPAA
jgi:carbon storage regulator CsrA